MAQISRITTWAAGQTLTAAALNTEFNNIITAWNNIDAGSSSWTTLKATTFSVTGSSTFSGAIIASSGSAGAPGINFGTANAGIFAASAGDISICGGGVRNWGFDSTGVLNAQSTGAIVRVADGSVSAPGLSFVNASGMGLYKNSGNLAFSCGGSGVFQITTTGQLSPFNDATQNLGSGSARWGTINTDALNVSNTKLQCGGTQVLPILQIVTATTATASNTTSSSFVDTNLTASITPKFSTSKILVLASGPASGQGANILTIARNGSNIFSTNGLQVVNTSSFVPCFLQTYDSPSTTSSVTYSVQMLSSTGISTVTFGMATITQYMTLIEIAQ